MNLGDGIGDSGTKIEPELLFDPPNGDVIIGDPENCRRRVLKGIFNWTSLALRRLRSYKGLGTLFQLLILKVILFCEIETVDSFSTIKIKSVEKFSFQKNSSFFIPL